MNLKFARTRYHYDSYVDFWRLVELSGFETCYVDEIDLTADVIYITSPINGELRPHVTYRRSILQGPQHAKIVWWNLERPDDGYRDIVTNVTDVLQYVDECWVSDKHYASLDPRLKHVVLGSHPGLREAPSDTVMYDYAHMSYVHGRRDDIMSRVRATGLREAPNGWGVERALALSRSRIMLNVHQTPAPVGEPLRFAIAAAYSMTLVSETLADPWPLVSGVDFVESSANDIPSMTMRIPDLGTNLHKRLCIEWNFRRGVEEGLKCE